MSDSSRLALIKDMLGITPETELADARKLVRFLKERLPAAEEQLARAQEAYDAWRREQE